MKLNQQAETALDAIDGAMSLHRKMLRGLAQRAAVNGKLEPSRLDRMQIACFDLAWVAAELAAASSLISAIDGTPLDRKLRLVFAADAMQSVLQRLERVCADAGADSQLHALRSRESMRLLMRVGASADALEEAGKAVAAGDDWGHVSLPEHAVMAAETFGRFAREVVAPRAEEIHRHDLTVPQEVLDPLCEMGVFGLSIPEEYGGSAADDVDGSVVMVAVTEALSKASLGAAGSLITRPEILSRALLAGGTEAQKQDWLPRIASGEVLCGISITEPDHGSDVAGLSLRATREPGGWRLNGSKTWCTFAGKAHVLMVVARTNPDRSLGHNGLGIFLVEKPSTDAHGFEHVQEGGGRLVGKAIPTIGYRGMHSYDLSFQDFRVPDDALIGGEEGATRGFHFTMAGMMGGRLQTAARACGVMGAALERTVSYVGERKVFGKLLRDYPLTQAKLALMASRLLACRRLAYDIAGRGADREARMNASLVKLIACRTAEVVTREALQLHGGMGYAEESPVSRYFVDARVLSIFEGAEETLALKVIARALLEDALRRGSNS